MVVPYQSMEIEFPLGYIPRRLRRTVIKMGSYPVRLRRGSLFENEDTVYVGDGSQSYWFIPLGTELDSIVTVHSQVVRPFVQILSKLWHVVVLRLWCGSNVWNLPVFSSVCLLAPEIEYHEDCDWSVGSHMFLRSVAALAPMVSTAKPVDFSWPSSPGHRVCLVGDEGDWLAFNLPKTKLEPDVFLWDKYD